ncbi:TetR/AcrR family transcriptional regulator [Nocardia sp. BMG111209]|uniref:TetR/AcrR family transcriptional regulator n=1 Tax=Nocardia sp. BMG111209 TaxID=1160137 RepID=UPI00036754F4|nr:TetR family transcriptional regulator [Nocardia sp. BMG111209]
MATNARAVGSPRAESTRRALLSAAERLFAEHGIAPVTHRQITDTAGQGNNAAVVYHFGTKAGLVAAIEEDHAGAIEQLRQRRVEQTGDSVELRDWITCLVAPLTDHLATSGTPTWYARFAAQCATEPAYHRIVIDNALRSPSLRHVIDRIEASLPDLPREVRAGRNVMMRAVLLHTCANFERAFAAGKAPGRDWPTVGTELIDAMVGLWQATASARPYLAVPDH